MENASSDDTPAYQFPDTKIVALEHPCIIRNLDRGIKSLGGNNRIQEVIFSPNTIASNGPVSPSFGDSLQGALCIATARGSVCNKDCFPENQDEQLFVEGYGAKTDRSKEETRLR
jgi:Tau95 Triple barrel domain